MNNGNGNIRITNGYSIASFVLGIVSFFLCGYVTGTLAVVFGIIAINQIDRSCGDYTGKGFAIAGIILGPIGIIETTILGIFTCGFGFLF